MTAGGFAHGFISSNTRGRVGGRQTRSVILICLVAS
jgi:hypothetical protein